jgi:phosphoribosylformimino-5-aminoimidazole carboxamide ribotide isomerase
MLLFPAIDLMDGQVVRLRQGKAEEKTIYPAPPLTYARKWQDEGGDWLHVVDLNAAFTGVQKNLSTVSTIAKALLTPVQLGGGMRSAEAVKAALDAGVSRVVIGTRAAESLEFVGQMVREFGAEKIAVGIDAKNGKVSVKGWTEESSQSAMDLARHVEDAGVQTIIYTDIATDGMMQGPNFKELDNMLAAVRCQLIASGGVSSSADVQRLAQRPRIHGAIIGKALYDNAIRLHTVANSLKQI